LHLHFFSQPIEVLGEDGKVVGFKIERTELDGKGGVTPTGEFRQFDVQAVYRAVGYFGSALPEVPFTERLGVIPNDGGRVLSVDGQQIPGVYATGWIKRGPIGLIGHTKSDAIETITNLIADQQTWWTPSKPEEGSMIALLESKQVAYVSWADWLKVDAEEVRLGEAEGRERVKLFDRADYERIVGRG
jgi:ferredoxin--NADP+ reductase